MSGAGSIPSVRLVIAGRDRIRRERLAAALAALPAITICAVAATSADAIIDAYRHRPDAVLLELGLPRLSAADTVRHLLRVAPGVLVYLLAERGRQAGISAALDAGARDVLDTALTPEQIAAVLLRARRKP